MAVVRLKKDEPYSEENFQLLMKKFRNKVVQEGILQELKKREYYVAPSLKKRLKSQAAEKRRRKRAKGYIEIDY